MGTKNEPGTFDCYHAAEDDEPMFILLARDPSSPALVQTWIERRFQWLVQNQRSMSNEDNLREIRKMAEAMTCAANMRDWKSRNPGKGRPV